MRIVLADVRSTRGFTSKDTVVGGYGSRLLPFTKVTRVAVELKRRLCDVPSVQLAYLAAIADRAGCEVVPTRGRPVDGDVAIVLSSLVDHRNECAFADAMRRNGVRVGFIGLAASKMTHLFEGHADFIIRGECEAAFSRLVGGERLSGVVDSPEPPDLDGLPFPRWDLLAERKTWWRLPFVPRPSSGVFPVLASRSCPEFCTYCPHRILTPHRVRSVANVVDELAYLCERYPRPYVLFRDPLFSEDRERCLAICDAIRTRGLDVTFECETRLDRLDRELLDAMHGAGLRSMSFGVEAASPATLKKSGRRPIPEAHQRDIIAYCRRIGVATAAFYVLGFLQEDWESIATTIDYAIALGSTVAQFKILTPYPGTPMFKQLEPLLFEADWERFDGFTPTFSHPNLTPEQLRFLLGAAYTRFYMRPSYLVNYLRIQAGWVRDLSLRLDGRVAARHARHEQGSMSRAVTC
ncbi:MAG: radical SAM protein [Vicinamibacterales bacterium]